MIDLGYGVRVHGPVLDGRWHGMLETSVDECVRAVAERGVDEVGLELIRVLKHPTGYYESHIRQDPRGPQTRVVHDDLVIYGPWLEGVGSRNYPVTRFRGYHTFRRVAQLLQKLAGEVVETTLRREVARLNG